MNLRPIADENAMSEGFAPLVRRPESLRVLLVAGDDRLRRVLRPVLRGAGFEILEARDGLAGLQRAIEEAPSLILLAADLPGLDGFALRNQLGKDRETRRIPVLVCTGGGAADGRGRDDRAVDVLPLGEPVDVLWTRIGDALRRAPPEPVRVGKKRTPL